MAPVYKFSSARSLVGPNTYYSSVLAGNSVFDPTPPSAYDLLLTNTLSGSSGNVVFSNLGTSYANDYQHLQFRIMARTSRVDPDDQVLARFNGDSGNNYSAHRLYSNGGTPTGSGNGSQNAANVVVCAGANNTSNMFTGAIVDILDPFDSNKYTTVQSFHGHAGSGKWIGLFSFNWRNTNALQTVSFIKDNNDFVPGSRFSLYGIKAA